MKALFSIVWLIWACPIVAQDTCFIRLGNFSGFDQTDSYENLVDTAYGLIQILPEDYQDDFNVYVNDMYLHVPSYEGGFESMEAEIIDTIESISTYYLAFITESNVDGLFQRLHVLLKVPFDEEYPCLNEDWVEKTRSLVAAEALSVLLSNSNNPAKAVLAEMGAMSLFKSELSHALNCCEILEGIRSSCSIECNTDKIVKQLTRNPSIAPGDLNNIDDLVGYLNAHPNEGRFIELEGIYDVVIEEADYNKLDFSGSSYEEFAIECKLDIYGENVLNITDWLEDLAIELEENSKSHKISIQYYNQSNINQIYLTDFGSSHGSSVERTTYDYVEDIVIINCDDGLSPRVLSRIKTSHYAGRANGNLDANSQDRDQRILPALIARELIRRAFMAGTSVAFNLGVEIAIEKIFAHGNECTWRDAWNSVEISVWDIMVWSAEGAIGFKKGQEMASALFGGLSSSFQYIMNTPNDEFSTEEFFTTFVSTSFLALVSGALGECSGRIYKKFTDNLVFEGKVISNNEFTSVAWLFLKNPGTIKAWKLVYNCPPSVRSNSKTLESISDAIERGIQNVQDKLNAITPPFSQMTLERAEHILRGNGNPTGGVHHITAILARTDISIKDIKTILPNGCYKANVLFPNGDYPPKDFFPDSWNEAKVLAEIKYAFDNGLTPDTRLGNKGYRGKTSEGIEIAVYMSTNIGPITTSYPIIP